MFKFRRKKEAADLVIHAEEIQICDRLLVNGKVGEVTFIGRSPEMTIIVVAEPNVMEPNCWTEYLELHNEMNVLVTR